MEQLYVVVRNEEHQYSIWFADRTPPAGWLPQSEARSKQECLEIIKEVWTDMTPLSLRKREPERADS